jgi:hypothetical protein
MKMPKTVRFLISNLYEIDGFEDTLDGIFDYPCDKMYNLNYQTPFNCEENGDAENTFTVYIDPQAPKWYFDGTVYELRTKTKNATLLFAFNNDGEIIGVRELNETYFEVPLDVYDGAFKYVRDYAKEFWESRDRLLLRNASFMRYFKK